MSRKYNRYEQAQRHKQITIKKFMVLCQAYSSDFDIFLEKHEDHYSNYYKRYWRLFYMSGAKSFAKKQTHKKARSKNKNILYNYNNQKDEELLNHSIYHKQFDYWWTVY